MSVEGPVRHRERDHAVEDREDSPVALRHVAVPQFERAVTVEVSVDTQLAVPDDLVDPDPSSVAR